ncbi:MAG: Holliday junction branch migration protein RuvA [Armatimonadaceae bacterium]
MIAQLRGYVVRVAAPTLVLDVNGVGYRVSVPASVLENLPPDGTPLTLITHMQVREDDMSLFGFLDDQELEVFNLLLSVSGVGPKASLAMLSALGSVGIAKAVAGEDVRTLTKVPGIGTRTAQRLVVDLKEKMLPIGLGGGSTTGPAGGSKPSVPATPSIHPNALVADVISALQNLGYPKADAIKAAESAFEQLQSAGKVPEFAGVLRAALSHLSR